MKSLKFLKFFMAFFLAAALLFGILPSCGGNMPQTTGTGGGDGPAGAQDPGEEQKATEARLGPELPDGIVFDGYVFTVLAHREDTDDWLTPEPREVMSEKENGEPINDAIYRRNSVVKEKYHIEFAMVANANEKTMLQKSVLAGDDIYDAVIMLNDNISAIVPANLLTEVSKLPYIDLGKPWWDEAVTSMSVAGKNYLLGGDILILDNEATSAILFNKDMMGELGMDLPYGIVKEGKWTFDRLRELMKGASADLNGDGQMTANEDRWGFVTFNDTLHALLVGGGGTLAQKDNSDIPYMTLADSKNAAISDKAMDIMYNKADVVNIQTALKDFGPNWIYGYEAYHGAFEQDRALFIWVRMRVVEKFRGMESNFGILPMPKYDDSQKQYHSAVNPWSGVLLGVPKGAGDLSRTGIILEALAAESRYTVQPAYYEIVLQRKFARDEESGEILDIIFNSRVYDIGAIYSFGNVFLDYIGLCYKSDTNLASYYEKRSPAMEKDIAKLVDMIKTMED